jgi:predicted phosphodiesterase
MAKPIKFVAAGDIHGDESDPVALKCLYNFMRDYKPDLTVCIGDVWDFRAIRKNASADYEESQSMTEDWEAGKDFFKKFFSFGEERVFLRGNHDERIYDLLNNAGSGLKRDYAAQGTTAIEDLAKKHRVQMFPYDSKQGVYKCGSLSFVHGYGHNIHGAKQHADTYGNVLFGHTHAIDYFRSVSIDVRECWNIGCLSNLNPSYNRNQMRRLRWQHGWAFGLIHSDGTHEVYQAKERNRKYIIPTNIKVYS